MSENKFIPISGYQHFVAMASKDLRDEGSQLAIAYQQWKEERRANDFSPDTASFIAEQWKGLDTTKQQEFSIQAFGTKRRKKTEDEKTKMCQNKLKKCLQNLEESGDTIAFAFTFSKKEGMFASFTVSEEGERLACNPAMSNALEEVSGMCRASTSRFEKRNAKQLQTRLTLLLKKSWTKFREENSIYGGRTAVPYTAANDNRLLKCNVRLVSTASHYSERIKSHINHYSCEEMEKLLGMSDLEFQADEIEELRRFYRRAPTPSRRKHRLEQQSQSATAPKTQRQETTTRQPNGVVEIEVMT